MSIARLLVLSAALVSLSAAADPVEAFHETYPMESALSRVNATFEANRDRPELRRAWVHIRLSGANENGEEGPEQQEMNKNVPGLSFEAESGEIRYQGEGLPPVVCAKLERSRFLFVKWERMRPTGLCSLRSEVLEKSVDDGFTGKPGKVAEIALFVEPTAPAAAPAREIRVPAGIQRP